MSVPLGTLLRGVSGALRLAAACADKLGAVCDAAQITVSWEFALVLGFLVFNKRWGWLALSVTISFIVAYERGASGHLSFGWISAAFDAIRGQDPEVTILLG